MKKHTNHYLFGLLGAVLLLACGCNILEPSSRRSIRFSASSPQSATTKAIFGEDDEEASYQMIDWEEDDPLLIAAKYAKTGNGDFTFNGDSYFTYTVGEITTEGHYSKGKLNETDQGLYWNPDVSKEEDEFWAIYPADFARYDHPVTGGYAYDGLFSGYIRDESAGDMRPPVLVAHAKPSSNANGASVTLYFQPAFTTFRLTLTNASGHPITVNSFSLISAENAPALSGWFDARISGLGASATVSDVVIGGSSHSVSALASAKIIPSNGSVVLYAFCLPQDLYGIKLYCTYTEEGRSPVTKVMDLSEYTFEACKQHRLALTLDGQNVVPAVNEVMKIILANAFPDLFIFGFETGEPELMYKDQYEDYHHKVVPLDVMLQKILEVRNVTITNDYGVCPVYSAEDMAAFVNLEYLGLDNLHTLSSISIDGLDHFIELSMDKADALHYVSVTNCPIAETVTIDSQSLESVTLENLTQLETIRINEANANSNLKTFTLVNCPDLKTALFGLVGGLEVLDLHDCAQMETLSVGLAYKLDEVDLSGCTSLKTIYINKAQSLPALDMSDCPNLESIEIVDAQKLEELILHDKEHLTTINITSSTQALKKVELVNLPELTSVAIPTAGVTEMTLSSISSAINSIEMLFPNQYGNMTCRELAVLSIDHCDGFTDIVLNPAAGLHEMHFDSCANLSSVTLKSSYTYTNVWNNPPTSSIVATKVNCPNLNDYYTVDNGGNATAQFNFD